jgi:hypothetical protein
MEGDDHVVNDGMPHGRLNSASSSSDEINEAWLLFFCSYETKRKERRGMRHRGT